MKIALGCDHGGFLLKEEVKKHLSDRGLEFEDFGCYSTESCDYPDMAERPCAAVLDGSCDFALLFCGTGIGISIAANKHRGIRAACCSDCFSARATRLHNNANVLCMGGRVVGPGLAIQMVDEFLSAAFEGGRHQRRIDKLTALER
ncbi:MAG: ribose 5-phosphate isomerase B [Clostridiales bacterium]|nr:ribose 5-phosphate isomerase B [Clostridiales bacterium]